MGRALLLLLLRRGRLDARRGFGAQETVQAGDGVSHRVEQGEGQQQHNVVAISEKKELRPKRAPTLEQSTQHMQPPSTLGAPSLLAPLAALLGRPGRVRPTPSSHSHLHTGSATMAPKEQKSKEAKALAAANSSKGKRKKWSKGKMKEKVNNAVLFDKGAYDKLLAEVPKYKMITPSILSDRLRINGSLARAAIRELATKGLIRPLVKHHTQLIYTRATGA